MMCFMRVCVDEMTVLVHKYRITVFKQGGLYNGTRLVVARRDLVFHVR